MISADAWREAEMNAEGVFRVLSSTGSENLVLSPMFADGDRDIVSYRIILEDLTRGIRLLDESIGLEETGIFSIANGAVVSPNDAFGQASVYIGFNDATLEVPAGITLQVTQQVTDAGGHTAAAVHRVFISPE